MRRKRWASRWVPRLPDRTVDPHHDVQVFLQLRALRRQSRRVMNILASSPLARDLLHRRVLPRPLRHEGGPAGVWPEDATGGTLDRNPLSVGIAPQGIGQVANRIAKKYPELQGGAIDSEEKRVKVLKWLPIEDVGIGRRQHASCAPGVNTAYDLRCCLSCWCDQ